MTSVSERVRLPVQKVKVLTTPWVLEVVMAHCPHDIRLDRSLGQVILPTATVCPSLAAPLLDFPS